MTDSYRAELRDLIDRTFLGTLGGEATAEGVRVAVWAALPDHMKDYLIGKGLASEVQSYFRAKGRDGLPRYPEANASGTHRQLELLSVDEFAYVRTKYLSRSRANAEQAERIAERCLGIHGVDISKLDVLAS